MKTLFLNLGMSLFLSFNTVAFASSTLDEYLSPDELATEMNLNATDYRPLAKPPSPQQVQNLYDVNVYQEIPVVIVISKRVQAATLYYYGQAQKTFPVSTGREQDEVAKSGRQYFSATPDGWYTPSSYVQKHWSKTWDALMEFAIFFNGGIAIHATTPDHYKQLGSKASGGCVRVHRDIAQWIWDLSNQYKRAYVPQFSRSGRLALNSDGSIKRREGSGTLIIVTSN